MQAIHPITTQTANTTREQLKESWNKIQKTIELATTKDKASAILVSCVFKFRELLDVNCGLREAFGWFPKRWKALEVIEEEQWEVLDILEICWESIKQSPFGREKSKVWFPNSECLSTVFCLWTISFSLIVRLSDLKWVEKHKRATTLGEIAISEFGRLLGQNMPLSRVKYAEIRRR